MVVLERLDHLVKRVGLYPAVGVRPRHLRWLPLVALALAAAGVALHVTASEPGPLEGQLIVLLAFLLSIWFAIFGPLRNPTLDAPLDEREQLVRTRAYLAGAGAVAVIAIVAALLFSLSRFLGIWTPSTPGDWRTICFGLIAVFNSVPPLHASWTTRPIDPEDE